jgi:CheY-like chemotaxis protein
MAASILVVDDDAPFRAATCRALRAAGHAVEEAPDGVQALRIIKADTPDILITDVIMPDGDGIGLVTAVKQAFPQVKIMVISGRGSMGNLNLLSLAKTLGADATLHKPLSSEDLLEKIAAMTAD